MTSLKGKVALVTGGSRGIGRAICSKFAALGADIFVNYPGTFDPPQDTINTCAALGVKAEGVEFDVSNSEAVEAGINSVVAKAGKLDILVNNAGISRDGLAMRLKDEDWQKTIAINLSGVFYCSRTATKHMLKARGGRIISISSVVGQMGNAGQVPYVSSKAGIIGLTKALAKEVASRGVTVNAVAPGFIETDMTRALDEKVRAQHLIGIPLGRYGQPEEVASLIAFLASDEASYITGQIVGINGGLYM